MSVRQSLLAILDQGPCYGYQLRAEFDRRTGSTWPLNVGQIYNTLDRLERDGLVEKGDVDEHGHVYWEITDAGADEVRSWLGLAGPARARHPRRAGDQAGSGGDAARGGRGGHRPDAAPRVARAAAGAQPREVRRREPRRTGGARLVARRRLDDLRRRGRGALAGSFRAAPGAASRSRDGAGAVDRQAQARTPRRPACRAGRTPTEPAR